MPRLKEHHEQRHKEVRKPVIFRPRDKPLTQLAPDASRDLAAFTTLNQVNLLVIDQFEEVFTQAQLQPDDEFFQWLEQVPEFSQGRTHVIVTIRSDYLGEFYNVPKLSCYHRNVLTLYAMSVDELSKAIQRPVQKRFQNGARRFEPALVQKLAQDASVHSTRLPLLQITLEMLWKRGSLKLSTYTNLTDAIQQRAETVYAFRDHENDNPQGQRPEYEQQELMGILLALVKVSVEDADHRDVRQPRTRHELEGIVLHH